MNIAEIKRLATTFTKEELEIGEAQLMKNKPLHIEVIGESNAQKLTHVLAALIIQHAIKVEKKSMIEAVRLFANRVRKSTIQVRKY
jgi:hypothetical protein